MIGDKFDIPRRAASDGDPRLWHLCPRNDVLHKHVSVWQQSFAETVVSSALRLIKLPHVFVRAQAVAGHGIHDAHIVKDRVRNTSVRTI